MRVHPRVRPHATGVHREGLERARDPGGEREGQGRGERRQVLREQDAC